jgi:hypothetical protein
VLAPGIADAADYELGWFRLGFELLPAGLIGVFFAAILAIHLSTISSHLNLGALYFTRDLYQRYLKPDASEENLVWIGRLATAVLLVGSFFYGMMMKEITQWLIFALWLMMAGIWLPNILQVVWWRFNAWGYLSAWMANLGVAWLVVWVLPAFGVFPPLPDYLQFWLLMALGALVFFPVTLMTKPERMDHLVRYYLQTRPIGWWGPVHAEAVRRGLIDEADEAGTSSLVAGDGMAGSAGAGSVGVSMAGSARRPFIKRTWTAAEAEAWTREDWFVIALSPLVMGAFMIGVASLLLLQPGGIALTLFALVGTGVIYWIIDPKLRAISSEYEQRQAKYLEELERGVRWDESGGSGVGESRSGGVGSAPGATGSGTEG